MQGHDLGEIPGHRAVTPDIRACADSCASTPACKAFTYSYGNESMPGTFNCWLKTRSDIHDDTDMRNTKRPDCCIDVVTVLRPTAIEPPPKLPGNVDPADKERLDFTYKIFGILGWVVAASGLFCTCQSHRATTRVQKARFLLDLRNVFLDKHKDVVHKVWSKVEGTEAENTTPIELDKDMGCYMGTLELCEVMLGDKIFDIATFYDTNAFRLEGLVACTDVMGKVFKAEDKGPVTIFYVDEYWKKFAKLLHRVHLERKSRGKPEMKILGCEADEFFARVEWTTPNPIKEH
jgi:hypothetical protein